MTDLPKSLFTVAEVANLLKVVPKTVARWIERGDLITYRFGGRIRIGEKDLKAFLQLHRGR